MTRPAAGDKENTYEMNPPVWQITNASEGLSQEQQRRTRRYLIAMAIRTACVVGAIFTPGPARWAMIFAAVVLPYLAVVMANSARERERSRAQSSPVQPAERAALPQNKATTGSR